MNDPIPFRQQVVAAVVGVAVVFLVFELIRRRKLREEYSWLWMLSGGVLLVLAFWIDLLGWMARLVGAVNPASALFLCGLLFLMGICIQYAVRISALSMQVKNLAQQVALLEEALDRPRKGMEAPPS